MMRGPFFPKKIYRFFRRHAGILLYILSGRKPWSIGYGEYKRREIARLCSDGDLLSAFSQNRALPANYGHRLDERIIEYPWILSRLNSKHNGILLDAGSTLNFDFILSHPVLIDRTIYIYTLAPEAVISRSNVSYIYGDLRSTVFKDGLFDDIVCVSTLEHVGMDNTFLYSDDQGFKESAGHDFLKAIDEFKRILKPGGRLFITVPFGEYENRGWFQQFNGNMVNSVVKNFKGREAEVAYYQYLASGWRSSTADQCAHCWYFDIHKTRKFDPDCAAASRAVACIELIK